MTSGDEASSRHTGPTLSDSTTSDTSAPSSSSPSTSSAEGSPARMYPARALAEALLESARVSGLSLPGSCPNSCHSGSSSRTSPAAPSSGSTTSAQSWDGSVMKRYRSRCRRLLSEHRTAVIGSSSLLPTPTASSYGSSGNGCPGDGREEYAHKGTPSLEAMAKRGLLPTPCASDRKGGNPRLASREEKCGPTLSSVVLYPTPTAALGSPKRGSSSSGKNAQGGPNLSEVMTHAVVRGTNMGGAARSTGHLSPRFVEWMQGLCPGWTDVDLDPWETPLFRSARRSSAK